MKTFITNASVLPESSLNKKSLNNTIEFWRFIAAFLIFMLHFELRFYIPRNQPYFESSYLCVEFFFILSGFLLAKHFSEHSSKNSSSPGNQALSYTLKKFYRLFPYFLFAFILIIPYHISSNNVTLESIKYLILHLWELIGLTCMGFGPEVWYGLFWYTSALLICGYFIYYLISKNQESFIYFIAPISIIIIYQWFAATVGHLDKLLTYHMIAMDGILRGFAGMSLGCITYYIYKCIKKINDPKKIFLLNLLELLTIAMCFNFLIRQTHILNNFYVLLWFPILIIISFQNCTIISKLLNNKISKYLGKLSLGIYLFQVDVFTPYFKYVSISNFWISAMACFSILVVLVICFEVLLTTFKKIYKKYTNTSGKSLSSELSTTN